MIVRSELVPVIEGTARPPTDSGTGGPPTGPVWSDLDLPDITGTTPPEKDRGNGN